MLESPPKVHFDKKTLTFFSEFCKTAEYRIINNDYLYWDQVKQRAKAKSYDPHLVWAATKFQRTASAKTLTFGTYQFDYTLTESIHKALHQFDLNIGGLLGSNIGIAETDKTKYVLTALMEEAINSSQMEGANTTRSQAKEMIQKERKPRTRSEQMILNNYVAMKHIVQHKMEDLTPDRVLYLHGIITRNTLDKPEEEGVFRSHNDVFVVDHVKSEAVHIPPPHQQISTLINDLCKFFNHDQDSFIHPIVKAITIHFMLAWIHPFSDGNGRTARALFYWYMLRNGYWLTEYLTISKIIKGSKIQYEKAYLYTENDDNDLTYFIQYNIKTMEKAFKALKEYIDKKQREVIRAARFLKIPGVNDRMAQLIKIIYEDPDRVFTAKEVQKRFNISNFTARSDMKQLVDLGFLEVVQVNKIKQNFIKSSKFDVNLQQYDIN